MGRLAALLRECEVLVQIAIDTISLSEAIKIASLMPERKELVLEAGTPLVKAWGMSAVRAMRSLRPPSVIVVDTKTADAARLEAEAVAKAGGDAYTVLMTTSKETIEAAIKAAEEYGLDIYGDTVGRMNLHDFASQPLIRGLTGILLHIGVDVQRELGLRASSLVDVVRELSKTIDLPIAVAGGIKPSEVEMLARAGARVIIIGSAITRASNPREAALEALESLRRAGAECR